MSDREDLTSTGGRPLLGISTAVAYVIGVVLLLLVIDFAGVVELAARLRILDDLTNMGIVQVTDADEVATPGVVFADPLAYERARTPIHGSVVVLAFALVLCSMLLRGVRYRLIANHAGVGDAVSGLADSYYFGLGMNHLLPFGPGEFASARALARNGADADAALAPAYYGRVFEVLALTTGIVFGFLALGWRGTFVPIVITFVVLVVLTAIVQPLGERSDESAAGPRGGIRGFLDWMNVTEITRSARRYFRRSPNQALGLFAISVVAIFVEVAGLWFLKQAFSRQLVGDYLLIDVTFPQFALVVAVVTLTRTVPLTPGAVGVYEGLTVFLFHFVFGALALSAVTVAILDSLLIALVTMVLFLYSHFRQRIDVKDTWRSFLRFSRDRATGRSPAELDAVVGGDAD